MILLTLNQGFDRRSIDLLLFLDHLNEPNYYVTQDGLLEFASLVAARLVDAERTSPFPNWRVFLSGKGKLFIDGWKAVTNEMLSKAFAQRHEATRKNSRTRACSGSREASFLSFFELPFARPVITGR